ncbi:MAG TPA: metallophosphoesterase [Armatimonadota bacterium]|nr:metallophosphoesterase [Armatimonadota bacterium]
MRLLTISDLHGNLDAAWAAIEAAEPDVFLSCGDWGDPDQVALADLELISERVPVYTVYGNHDPLEALAEWVNQDGSPVLLQSGELQRVGQLAVAGINGIWAKSHRKPFYVTDEDVDEAALRVAGQGAPVDILLSHACPSGVADVTRANRHGGQRCFLRAFQVLRPRVYLTGHLHRAQEHRTRDGQVVRNVGHTPSGDATLIVAGPDGLEVTPFEFS